MIYVIRRSKLRELRDASPLTGLPGNRRIRREISRRITVGAPFAVCYLDIDRFKSFNDAYGFVRGDGLILLLSEVLGAACANLFIGHVGGDDFVVICPAERVEELLAGVIAEFERRSLSYYDPADATRGFLTSRNRLGQEEQWPLVALSVGVAGFGARRFRDAAEIVSVANEMKGVAKREPGSYVAIDRRRG